MYTLENLKPLNGIFDTEHKLEQRDVEMVNYFVKLIESTRKENPCPGDIIEYTDEYGDYSHNTHIRAVDEETGQLSIRICPHVPIIYRNDNGQEVEFHNTGGGPLTSVHAADLTYIGKREKMFSVFSSHCLLPAHSALDFYALVNVWEYITPNQMYPGYSTKNWARQYMAYVEKPQDGSEYHYYGNFNEGLVFRKAKEVERWKATYKAVEFPGGSPNHSVLFHYRETDKLVSREDWDALDFPLDTRWVNGKNSTIHVKVAYDDDAHVITVYRFTNSGYLDWLGEYEKAKGTALVAPGPEIKGII